MFFRKNKADWCRKGKIGEMKKVKNIVKHFKLVCRHRWVVFKLSLKLGIPFRGLVHDLSKFSPEEFIESVKYYEGSISPIIKCSNLNGYSRAWLHHKGRNKHHEQYWVDLYSKEAAPVIPYKYFAEMICDKLAASIIYGGKNWKQESEYEYWQKEKTRVILNPKVSACFTEVFRQVKDNGITPTLNKKNIKNLYKKFCIDDKTKYEYVFSGEWKKID